MFVCVYVRFLRKDKSLCSKSESQMFPLISGRHVGAQSMGHQHGVSILSSINVREMFLRISQERYIA